MIKAIIFDLGGVIACEDWDSYGETVWQKMAEFLEISHDQLGVLFHKFYRDEGLRLGRGSETEFFSELADISPNEISENDVKDFFYSLFYAKDEMVLFVKKLSLKYPLYMISNDVAQWFDYKIEKFGIKKYFRHLFCSGNIGYAKPDPRIYEYALSKIPEAPIECVFVDNIERNLPPMKELGVKTILFSGVEKLKEELEKLGIKP
ncbi:MAG: HAD-IA family hydrolase [Candidatus Aenigmarchaeota archaeon]|nr:HAD-IA family hydrolase [Candidatus Aenigmarchaeota archaeon]